MDNIIHLEYKWTVSRGRDTYGYNICTLYADGQKVARCNGGGYDMEGTCFGDFLARNFAHRLLTLKESFYGLTFHDPNYDPGKAVIGQDVTDRTLAVTDHPEGAGMTVKEAEDKGISLGLERYQAIYAGSSPLPTDQHIIPSIDGGCGKSSVEKIANAIGLTLEWHRTSQRDNNKGYYLLHIAE